VYCYCSRNQTIYLPYSSQIRVYLFLIYCNKSTSSQSEYSKSYGQKRKWHITPSVLTTDSFDGQFLGITLQISPVTVIKVWWHISRLRKITPPPLSLFFSRHSVWTSWMSAGPTVSLMIPKWWIGTGYAENKIFLSLFFQVVYRKVRYFGLQRLNYDNWVEFCSCQAVTRWNTNVCFENHVPEF
jgi:hypothetical protein